MSGGWSVRVAGLWISEVDAENGRCPLRLVMNGLKVLNNAYCVYTLWHHRFLRTLLRLAFTAILFMAIGPMGLWASFVASESIGHATSKEGLLMVRNGICEVFRVAKNIAGSNINPRIVRGLQAQLADELVRFERKAPSEQRKGNGDQ